MTITTIVSHSDLLQQLAGLKLQQEFQEEELKGLFGEFISTINLGVIFKAATNHQQTPDIAKMGLTMLVNLITGFVLGKNRSIKGYLSSVMVEKFTTSLIDHNLISIISTISSLFNKQKNENKIL